VKKIFFILFLLSSLGLFGQTELEPIYMYVSLTNGLRVRDRPSLSGKIIKVLPYGEMITLNSNYLKPRTEDTIDGINDYWYYISVDGEDGWIFGGYLIDRLESDPIVGFWRKENARQLVWYFSPSGRFIVGLSETGGMSSGSYELRGNTLILIFDASYFFDGEYYPPSRTEYRAQIIDSNKIIITGAPKESYNNGTYIRDNSRFF